MYINTFKYTPKDVSCQLCTEYVKKLGCTALRCPWLAERIEAGVVGYREAVLETFPHERRLFQRLNLLIKHYPGSLWSSEQHERRMQYQCAVQGYRRRRDTNAYYAAMYLLTSNDDIYRRTANCFCKDGIEFGYRRAAEAAKASLGAVGKAAGAGSPCAGAVRHRPAGTVQAELERKAAGYAVCRGGRPNRLTALRKGLKQYGCISR